jgi:hypothetical protein
MHFLFELFNLPAVLCFPHFSIVGHVHQMLNLSLQDGSYAGLLHHFSGQVLHGEISQLYLSQWLILVRAGHPHQFYIFAIIDP